MSKGTLLRKSGVAIRKETTPKKRSTGLPKPAELRKKIAIAEAKKNKTQKSGAEQTTSATSRNRRVTANRWLRVGLG